MDLVLVQASSRVMGRPCQLCPNPVLVGETVFVSHSTARRYGDRWRVIHERCLNWSDPDVSVENEYRQLRAAIVATGDALAEV